MFIVTDANSRTADKRVGLQPTISLGALIVLRVRLWSLSRPKEIHDCREGLNPTLTKASRGKVRPRAEQSPFVA